MDLKAQRAAASQRRLFAELKDLRRGQVDLAQQFGELLRSSRDSDARLEALYAAFPHQDLDGHRRYHEELIALVAENRKLRRAVQERLITGLLWAALVFTAAALWQALRRTLGGG